MKGREEWGQQARLTPGPQAQAFLFFMGFSFFMALRWGCEPSLESLPLNILLQRGDRWVKSCFLSPLPPCSPHFRPRPGPSAPLKPVSPAAGR